MQFLPGYSHRSYNKMKEYKNSPEDSIANTISEPQSEEDVFDKNKSDDMILSEIDFEIDFEDDLGPSLKEMLEEASREVQIEQKDEGHDDVEEERLSDPDQHNMDTEGKRWYVIHCYSGYENKVCHNLEQRIESMGMNDHIFDVVVPTEEEIAVKDGKRRIIEREVFPGYILVQMELSEESWYVVRNTPGVTGFVGMGSKPIPLQEQEVSHIIQRMEADAPRITVTFKVNGKVRIIDGPFNDFIGTVTEIDVDRAKVRVMVSFFGRETPVELDFLQVEKI